MKSALLQTALVLACAALAMGCTRIKPDETGVRTLNFGKAKGVVEQDYAPGYHRYLWPLDTWHRFPSTVQRLRFAPWSTDGPVQREDALPVTSADGDRVAVTAEVVFRIADQAAHQVLKDSGRGDRYLGVVRDLAQDSARVVFGRLKTEHFYDPERRESARSEGIELLRTRLHLRGIELVDFLVETMEFEPNYENLIRDKKVADQRVELEKAKARAAAERGKVATIHAETTVKVQQIDRETQSAILRINTETAVQMNTLKAAANKYAAQRQADADLYAAQKAADGQRLLLAAEAEGTRRLNTALSGDGSQNLVVLEGLKKMNLSEVTFPSAGLDWLNPRAMARHLGAESSPTGDAADTRNGAESPRSTHTSVQSEDENTVPALGIHRP
jgi:hypothetical protein